MANITFSTTLYVLFSTWLIWYVSTGIVAYRRLKHIPGPPLAAITSLWWIRAATSERAHIELHDLCTRYGSIARMGPYAVVTDDAELFRKANSTSKDNGYRKSEWYAAFKMDGKRSNIITERDDTKSSKMRSKSAMGYSGKDNPMLEPSIDKILLNAIDLIKRKYLSNDGQLKPLDLAIFVTYFAMDVITMLSLGEPFGYISDDEDKYDYVKSIADNMPVINFFSVAPLLAGIMRIPAIQNRLIPDVDDKVGVGKVKGVTRRLIAKRFSGEKMNHHDMALSFKNHGMTEEEIADEALIQLLAGSDTTGTILRTGLLSIITNPRVHRKLLAEISSITPPIPSNSIVSNTQASQLPYLQACIKEAHRHHPAGSGLLPRVVGPEGDTHKGIYLPPGTEVGFASWKMHRNNTELYGPDAAIYRPERWLEADPVQLSKMEESVRLVFGHGRHRCLGENIARIEIQKFFVEMVRRFDFQVGDPMRVCESDRNYGLFFQKGMWVVVREREWEEMEGVGMK